MPVWDQWIGGGGGVGGEGRGNRVISASLGPRDWGGGGGGWRGTVEGKRGSYLPVWDQGIGDGGLEGEGRGNRVIPASLGHLRLSKERSRSEVLVK